MVCVTEKRFSGEICAVIQYFVVVWGENYDTQLWSLTGEVCLDFKDIIGTIMQIKTFANFH